MNDNDDAARRPGGADAGQADSGAASGGSDGAASGGSGGAASGRSGGGAAVRSGGDRPVWRGFRLLTMATVIVGVLLLAAAAFVFSYAPVRDIALASGLRAGLARVFPLLPDAVLVVACAAALALRGAKWWTRWFTWLSILVLIALVGTVDAVHAMAIKLPRRPVAATVAVLPWALLLLGLRLWLSVLRHGRVEPTAAPAPAQPAAPAVAQPAAPAVAPQPAAGPGDRRQPGDVPADAAPPSTAGPAHTAPPLVAALHEAAAISAEPVEAVQARALPAGPASDASGSAAAPAWRPTGLDLILPPLLDEPPADGGNYTDATVELAMDADPEPDDPSSDDDDASSVTSGGYHGSALPPGIEDPALDPAAGFEATPPLLSAPVPEPDDTSPDDAAPGDTSPDDAETGAAAPGDAAPDHPGPAPPERPEPGAQPPERSPRHGAPPAEFQRVRSSPVPPGKSKR